MNLLKTSNLGYPRIGENREWKKALEQYWAGKIDEQTLEQLTEKVLLSNIQKQIKQGIDFIPVNDFTYYDHMLDTATMFGVVPTRYGDINDTITLNQYFSMARGNSTAVASEMTKWFNTNYHYIIPELNDVTFRLVENKPLKAYRKVKDKLGIEGKPVMVGPYTFLKLSKGYNEKQIPGILLQLIPLYQRILKELQNEGVQWVQIDEPILVTSITSDELKIVQYIYNQLHEATPSLNIMLQTYFDSVDAYETITSLPVQGIGLDFVHGLDHNLRNIQTFGFPEDKVLGLGIIDGRNIWKADLNKKKEIIDTILELVDTENVWIQPSCSLLHVPITTNNESSIDEMLINVLAFADEKLHEIQLLKNSYESDSNDLEEVFTNNKRDIQIINMSPARNKSYVHAAIKNITDQEFKRNENFEQRKEIQKKYWQLPDYPTTTIGSFPQTIEVRKARRQFKNGEWTAIQYDEFIENEIARWISIQEEIGLDVLVHGEFERNDMVEYFGEKLSGFTFSSNGWVQSYGSRCVKPPIIYGDVAFIEPMTLHESLYAKSLTNKPVKGMLTGPATILNWSFVRDDIARKEVCFQIALALREEIQLLEQNDIKMIQVDEPALREGLPLKKENWKEYLDWGVQSFLLATSSVEATTQIHTHMCYCDFNNFLDVISKLDADIISIETSRSHGELLQSSQLKSYDKGIGLGVYDIHSPRVPSVEEITEIIEKYTKILPKEQIWVNPDCGLKTRKEEETVASLQNMVKATEFVRNQKTVNQGI
ncbi:5-methyltetrahydropteroyltriglutamate--homocysteine S-methyltransferase [Bacillus sp. AGMB 02131]|uniref:5-methyltetrahydropteroyltriglutamate--homocysteine methyltransferase n=1 Tax=Peribacillus faecalis TaxID=2772559 RepID=A0A927CTX6_9BACI|nr:5-methyltetrahydropteroyltriglutamate--homocysteine S-methyltransferase [Peribacillus faecalis]MBD3107386.1 5-methyltetrahydropteroyltriglutamate--homocysteine S-methyltransferase [Peribacillus faecalis]